MEFKLLQPFDKACPEFDQTSTQRLMERYEFDTHAEWAIYQAKVYYEIVNDVGKAVEVLKKQLSISPSDARLHFCLAECYSRMSGGSVNCLKECEEGLQLDAESDYGYTIKARAELALQRPIAAYESAIAALKINSRNYEAGFYLGTIGFAIAQAAGDIEEMRLSIQNLRITLSLNPDSTLLADIIAKDEEVLAKMR